MFTGSARERERERERYNIDLYEACSVKTGLNASAKSKKNRVVVQQYFRASQALRCIRVHVYIHHY